MADSEYSLGMSCLRGIPNDLIAHGLSNLLIVEPRTTYVVEFNPMPYCSNKKHPVGVIFITGGVRHFYGLLHTTSGNLQGNFAIFIPKTNFAPRPSRILSTSRKKIPKQTTGNLLKKLYIFVDFLTNFWYNAT